MLKRAQVVMDRASHITAVIGGCTLLFLSLGICAEIVLRRTVGFSMQGVDEIGGYALAGVSAFGFGYALLNRAHTRIDIFIRQGSRPVQAALNLLAALVMPTVAIFMAWRAAATFLRSWELGSLAATPLQTPIWIPQAIWVAGLVFFSLVAVLLALRAVAALARGADQVNAVSGSQSLLAEIELERSGAEEGQER